MEKERTISAQRPDTGENANQANVDLDAFDENGDTVLHALCKNFTVREINKIINDNEANKKILDKAWTLRCPYEKKLRCIVSALTNYSDEGLKKCKANGDFVTHYLIDLVYENSASLNVPSVNVEFIKWLISKGFDFNIKNKNEQSAFHRAIEYDLEEIVLVLSEHSKDIHCLTKNNETLLHLLFAKRHKGTCMGAIMKILLDRGINVDAVSNYGLTALQMAVNSVEKMKVIEMLLQRTSKLSVRCGITLMYRVIRNMSSQQTNYLEIMRILIAKGADVNSKDVNGSTPLHYAFEAESLEAVLFLKENGANFNSIAKDGKNLFHALGLTRQGDDSKVAELVDILLGEGCDINAVDDVGKTPLHCTCETGNIVVTRKLLELGADVHRREKIRGWTPLHVAVATKSPEVRGRLCRKRPWLAATTTKKTVDILTELFKRGALVNARDREGNSALSLAVRNESIDVIRALLMFGADINDECVTRLWPQYWKNGVDKILIRHLIKLKSANLTRSDEYKLYFEQTEYQKLFEVCLREIEILKKTFIDDRMTLYGWLHMDPNRRHIYSQNEKLMTFVNLQTVEQKCPQYLSVIRGTYCQTISREPLIEPAKEAWIRNIIYLPDICLDCILSVLNDGDLLSVIEMDKSNEVSISDNFIKAVKN